RFGLTFSAIGLIVGTFGIGGLLYAASVQQLVNRFGQAGLAIFGGVLLGLAYLTLALGAGWWLTPIAVTAIGLGFYALHNTLQTNATQMTPQARGTAVAIFSSAIYLGQTLGVAAGALVFDRFMAVPLFVVAAVSLPALAWWVAAKIRRRTMQDGRPKAKNKRTKDPALIAQKSHRIADIRVVRVVPGAEAPRFLPLINPLGRLANLTCTLAPCLGPARVNGLTQQWTWRGMLSDRRTPSLGRPAWAISAGRKNLKRHRRRSLTPTRASSSRSLRRARAS